MNLFQKYGIKEVADVVFYSINEVGDEEFYTPVLYLDTLKVSTLEKTSEKVFAQGGYGNKRLIGWNFGKEITLTLEDALFSPASMSLIWGGRLNSKLSMYTEAIVKCKLANKYGELHYSTKAYPSPALTDEQWDIFFQIFHDFHLNPSGAPAGGEYEPQYLGNTEEAKQNRKEVIRNYFKRTMAVYETDRAMPEHVLQQVFVKTNTLDKIGYIDTKREDTEVIDRMEKCIVTKKEGFIIDTRKQKENLFRYYANDKSSSYTIYYDAKTMLPLLHIENNKIVGWNSSYDNDANFRLKLGTIYYKWTRTVKRKEAEDDGILGRQLVIDAETFPDSYRIVGETYIREQKTGKDQRYQFTIFKANVSADTNITLQADGDPTTFSMSIDVLTPPNDIMMELKEYDVEEDLIEGGTRILPQKSTYTYTPTMFDEDVVTDVDDNNEIY